MTYDPNTTHGYADQKSFMEIPIAEIPALTGIEEPTRVAGGGEVRRFAHLVYQVNSVPVNLSGDVVVDTDNLEAINANGFSTLSAQIDDIITNGTYERPLTLSVECSGDFTWVAEALPGTDINSNLWRVKQIEDITVNGFQTVRVLWADGDGNFDNPATPPLSGLSYS